MIRLLSNYPLRHRAVRVVPGRHRGGGPRQDAVADRDLPRADLPHLPHALQGALKLF